MGQRRKAKMCEIRRRRSDEQGSGKAVRVRVVMLWVTSINLEGI